MITNQNITIVLCAIVMVIAIVSIIKGIYNKVTKYTKEDKYAFMLLAEVDYNNLGVKNETKLYQTVLSLLGLKSRLKTYKVVPKLEKESLLFVPLYTYAASVNYKLALKKLGFKIGG